MTERRLPPALEDKVRADEWVGDHVTASDLLDWLYGNEGMVPSTWTPGDPEPEPTPGLVERVVERAAEAWNETGDYKALAYALEDALRAELGIEP